MNNKKLLALTPAILAGSAIPFQNTNAVDNSFNERISYEQQQQNGDKWLIRIINYYYSRLEENVNDLTSKANFNSSKFGRIKNNTIKNKMKKLYKLVDKLCSEKAWLTSPGKMVFPIDKKDFHPYVAPISSFYGPRTLTHFGNSFIHKATDIMATGGTSVLAPLPGYIVYTSWESKSNLYTVLIYHGNGVYTRWAHVNPVKRKGFVNAGDVFARVRYRSRISTGPHIHMELIKKEDGKYYTINPYSKENDYSFTFLNNNDIVGEYDTYFENLRFNSSYKSFVKRGKWLFKRYYRRRYKEMSRHKIHALVWGNKKLNINENKLNTIITENIKKSLLKKVIAALIEDFDEMTLAPDFVRYFSSTVNEIMDVALSKKGGYYYRTKSFDKYYEKAIDKYYPEIVYEGFKNYFSTLNLRIFAHIVDKITIFSNKNDSPYKNNEYLKNLLKYDKRLKNILWQTYRKFTHEYNEQIKNIFFLNLDLPEKIDSLDKLIKYNKEIIKKYNNGELAYNHLKEKLRMFDIKLSLLKENINELFKSIIEHPGFNDIIYFSRSDFNVYLRKCFNEYVESFKLNRRSLTNLDVKLVAKREKDKIAKHLCEAYPLGDELSKFIRVKDKGDRLLVFFESPGHFFGQKITGVKLVREVSEKALLLIEQENKKGKNYRVVARFKPKYSGEFKANGFCFEIYKYEKLLHLKSFDEYCQVKQYLNLEDLKNVFLTITVHPLEITEVKARLIKKLLKPFEYSVPVALTDFETTSNTV